MLRKNIMNQVVHFHTLLTTSLSLVLSETELPLSLSNSTTGDGRSPDPEYVSRDPVRGT